MPPPFSGLRHLGAGRGRRVSGSAPCGFQDSGICIPLLGLGHLQNFKSSRAQSHLSAGAFIPAPPPSQSRTVLHKGKTDESALLELSKQTHLCAAAIMENFHLTYTLWKSGCVPRTQGRLRGAFRPPTPGAACGRAAASTAGVFSADLEPEGSREPGVGGAEDAEGYDEALCVKGPRTSSGELAERPASATAFLGHPRRAPRSLHSPAMAQDGSRRQASVRVPRLSPGPASHGAGAADTLLVLGTIVSFSFLVEGGADSACIRVPGWVTEGRGHTPPCWPLRAANLTRRPAWEGAPEPKLPCTWTGALPCHPGPGPADPARAGPQRPCHTKGWPPVAGSSRV